MSVVAPDTNGDSVLDSIHVLHVDDEPDFADLAGTFLEREDEFSVTTVTSARDGLERLEETEFDCIISDYEMPRMDGLEFLEAVRESFPELPFILFTGKGSEDVAADAIEAGVTAYQQKEIGTAQYTVLANRVRSHVDQYRTKQEAHTLKQEYGLIAEMATDVFWVYDPATDSASLSDGVTQFGYAPDEIDGAFEWWREHLHPDDWDRIRAFHDGLLDRDPEVFETLTAERGVASVEYRFRKADGSYAHCESSCIVLFEDDAPVKIAGALTDISEQKAYQQELETARKRMEVALENTDAIIWEWSPDSGDEYAVYPSPESLFGTELGGYEEFLELVHPSDRAAVEAAITDSLESGEPYSSEYRIVRDGEIRWIQAEGQVFQDVPGGATRMVGVAMDVTARRVQERALEQSEARYRSLTNDVLDTSNVGTFLLDSDFNVVWVNNAIEEYFGVEREVILGADKRQLIDREIRNRVEDSEAFQRTVTGTYDDNTYVENFECHILPGDGREERWLEHWSQPIESGIYEGGRIEHYTDITDRREQKHELVRKNERLEEFASIVSHDLRNPLSVAEGRLELAREDCDSEHLDHADRAIDRTKTLIDDLLTLARQGETVDDIEPLDLREIAAESWCNVGADDSALRNEVDCTVYGDESRLKQLLENLFGNSVKHGDGDVTITLGTTHDGFYVEDDGPGIPETERDAVFQAGYSLSDDGTGFGLNIVKRVAEAHDWDVTVTEGATGGARFEFTGVKTDC